MLHAATRPSIGRCANEERHAMRKVMTLVVTVAALTCLPGRALADPVRVTSGSSDLNRNGDVLGFLGLELLLQQWFPGRSEADLGLWQRLTSRQSTCDGPCIAGDILNLSLRTTGDDVNGQGVSSVGVASFGDVGGEQALPPLLTAADLQNPNSPFAVEGLVGGSNNGLAFVPVATGRPVFLGEAGGPGLNF